MEKLLYNYLLLDTLSVLVCFLYLIFIDRNEKTKINTTVSIVNYIWIISIGQYFIADQTTYNQCKLFENPIQLRFCPILRGTSKSIFAD